MAAPGPADVLTFLSCGSVDDGKSTLLGRLLVDTGNVFEDQLAALEVDSRRHGTRGGERDFALLLDGLQAEREQGITLDVAWRYFSTPRRRFVVADTPGHEQYTRNMVTGASRCAAAVLLVDARKGLLTQTLGLGGGAVPRRCGGLRTARSRARAGGAGGAGLRRGRRFRGLCVHACALVQRPHAAAVA